MSSTPPYKRILIKLSGEAFQEQGSDKNLDSQCIERIASQLKEIHGQGFELALVVGGGNIFRGLSGERSGISRSQGDYMGMLATVINALALQSALEHQNVPTRVMTALAIPSVAEPFIRRRAIRHLEKGRIVIFGAGTGNPYFTTDSAAALRASEIKADLLAKATKVDGVYTEDPVKNPHAIRFPTLSYVDAISRDLRVMDTAAFSICRENDIPIVVFDFFQEGALARVVCGEPVGTLITR